MSFSELSITHRIQRTQSPLALELTCSFGCGGAHAHTFNSSAWEAEAGRSEFKPDRAAQKPGLKKKTETKQQKQARCAFLRQNVPKHKPLWTGQCSGTYAYSCNQKN